MFVAVFLAVMAHRGKPERSRDTTTFYSGNDGVLEGKSRIPERRSDTAH
jgi:hypothetical protein